MSKKAKHVDLQPYLEYFGVLKRIVRQGMLQIGANELQAHECYITQPALFAVSRGDDPQEQLRDGSVTDTLRRLRTYAAWLAAEGMAYLKQPFRVHVVKDTPPHDLVWTFILRRRKFRRWKDTIDVIPYPDK